jgi:hypothetical protein
VKEIQAHPEMAVIRPRERRSLDDQQEGQPRRFRSSSRRL